MELKNLLLEILSIYEIEVMIKTDRNANKVNIYNAIRAIEGVVVVKVEQNSYLNTLITDKVEYSLLHMKYLVYTDPVKVIKEIKRRAMLSNNIEGLLEFIPRLKTLEKKTVL
jgi:hypothetical protein